MTPCLGWHALLLFIIAPLTSWKSVSTSQESHLPRDVERPNSLAWDISHFMNSLPPISSSLISIHHVIPYFQWFSALNVPGWPRPSCLCQAAPQYGMLFPILSYLLNISKMLSLWEALITISTYFCVDNIIPQFFITLSELHINIYQDMFLLQF